MLDHVLLSQPTHVSGIRGWRSSAARHGAAALVMLRSSASLAFRGCG